MTNPLEKQIRANTVFPSVFHWVDLVINSSSSHQHSYFRGDFDANESKFMGLFFTLGWDLSSTMTLFLVVESNVSARMRNRDHTWGQAQ